MAIWAIADLHASQRDPCTGRPSKPMDAFGPAWHEHLERLEVAWRRMVAPEDTVVVAGDIDWALRLDDAMETLLMLARWPGTKVLLRGNHDYWWSSKTTNRVRRALPPTITLLHNNSVEAEGINICGAKGSPVPGAIDWTEEQEKSLRREVDRLERSLEARQPGRPTIVALHYPPFYGRQGESRYREIIERAGAEACVYGHLHAEAGRAGPRGRIGRTEYILVAGDAVGWKPVLVAAGGQIVQREVAVAEDGEESLGKLAEEAMDDKREEVGDEAQVRELYDVPTESAGALADQQEAEDSANT